MYIRARPCIILLGDSLTQFGFGDLPSNVSVGWASLLAAAYSRRCDVLNRGFSGYNTQHILDLMPSLFPDKDSSPNTISVETAFCTVWLGANDAAPTGEPQHISIEQYARNLEDIVVRMRHCVGLQTPILLLTPPPVDEVRWMASLDQESPDRTNEVAREYGLEVLKIAKRHERCVAIDTWEALLGESDERSRFLVDGLHLNEDGNRQIFETILQTITENFPEVAPISQDNEGGQSSVGVPMEGAPWRELCQPGL